VYVALWARKYFFDADGEAKRQLDSTPTPIP
jgi:hypothetical protein